MKQQGDFGKGINTMERITTDAQKLRNHILAANSNVSAAEFAKANFWHYTSLSNAEKIIAGTSPGFVISSFEQMNDLDEAELHKDELGKLFSLCFCNTDKEKIPMWYMYSDLEGKGVALGLTPARMLKFIHSISEVFPFVDGKPLSVSFKSADGERLLHRLDLMGICVSTGAACDSVNTRVSHVLQAIGTAEEYVEGTIRISLSSTNTFMEVNTIGDSLLKIFH